MSDDTRPDEIEPEEEQPEEGQTPPSRLDRLMGAKDRADKEAVRWSEIEDLGLPVPSQDQAGDVTQPSYVEPPFQEGDTAPTGDTPPEGMPPVRASQEPPAPARGAAPPPFPHPTDRPLTPPAPGAQPPARPVQPRSMESLPEPPRPPQTDREDTRRGFKPLGGPQQQRYQPSEVNPEDVRVDSNGMPLPRRVPREDRDATVVSESAYRDDVVGQQPAPTAPHGYERPDIPEPPTFPPRGGRAGGVGEFMPPQAPARPRRARRRLPRLSFSWGCLGRGLGLSVIIGLVALMLGGGASAIYYSQVTAPSFENINTIQDLQKKALQFNTTRIRDRQGTILYQINDPQGGFRTYKTLDEVSPWVIVATVATEERGYFSNPGFSIPAIIRAVIKNLEEGRAVSGASTITQQLTRALLLPEEERTARSYQRKIKEVFLAAELGRRFDKKQILELYLNQIYYGNLAYGIEAAAQTYFGKSAKDLTLAEASFLAGLPQAPAVWDPVNNKEGALVRQKQVLDLMLKAGCIDTGDVDLKLPCTTQDELNKAQPELAAIAARQFNAPAIQAKYPHWVVYIQQQLEKDPTIGPSIYTSGYDVYTTLDPRIQDLAQDKVNLVLSGLTERNVHNASVVVIDPHTGAILAMIGSRDFNDESIKGQVNVALTPQQPGSSIKPFTYMAAFRKGWTPATVLWDVPISYEIPGFGIYAPVNYDGKFRGPVTVRTAIANSLNVPAVETLDFVGVPALLQVLNDVGVTSLGDPSNPNQYGLSLTLGAGEVYLLDWTNAYATLARGGKYLPTYGIDRIELNGKPIAGYPYQPPEAKQVLDPDQTFLLTSILSDKEARVPEFGRDSVISPPYPAAAKTGTTNDFRDNWTMGYTTEIAVGVWVGNTDNSPMLNVSGVTGAGPIWRGVMDGAAALPEYQPQPFARPKTIDDQTVCDDDGALPSDYCVEHSTVHTDVFGPKNRPPDKDKGIYRQVKVDSFTGLIANENCQDFATDKFFMVLPNPSQLIDIRPTIKGWLLNTDQGKEWMTRRALPTDRFEDAPTDACKPDSPKPTIVITNPQAGQEYSGLLKIKGTVDAPDFAYYTVDFGLAEDPIGWGVLQVETNQTVHDGKLGEIDLSVFDSGPLTIRVTVYDTKGHHAERRVTVRMVKPTPTPGPTVTPLPTDTPAPTVTPTVAAPTPAVETPTIGAPTATP